MRWFSREEHARIVAEAEGTARCPGCDREVTTFSSLVLPGREEIGVACADCLDGETVERLDPRQDAGFIREAIRASDQRYLERRPDLRRKGD